ATNYIAGVGAFMSTDPVNGTSGSGEFNGTVGYFDFWAPGLFSVAVAWSTPTSVISLSNFALNNQMGGYVQTCFGFYADDGGGYYTRTGGHCITVTGVAHGCSANPTLYFRDPADDAANTSQSPFITRTVGLFPSNANFRGNPGQAYEFRT